MSRNPIAYALEKEPDLFLGIDGNDTTDRNFVWLFRNRGYAELFYREFQRRSEYRIVPWEWRWIVPVSNEPVEF